MGNRLAVHGLTAMYIAFCLHTVWNTPADWLIAGVALGALLWWLPDKPLNELYGVVRTYYKNKVDYRSWFKK